MATVEQIAGAVVVKIKTTGPQGAADQLIKTTILDISDARTLELSDAGKFIRQTSADPKLITIPPNSDVAFEVGTVITFEQAGAGQLEFAGGVGVTLNSYAGSINTLGQYAVAGLTQVAADVWTLYGNIT